MFINQRDCLYPSMSQLLERAVRTGVHPNPGAPKQVSPDCCVSDTLLYVQSNGRAQVGHDERGRMVYLSTAAKRDFPLPTLTQESDQMIGAQPGMFYQADIAMMLGNLYFSLTLEDGTLLTAGDEGSSSCYLDHFLPATSVDAANLSLTSFSLAPVLEPGMAAIPGLPIPGPSGAIHALYIKNNAARAVSMEANLHLSENFISQYQFSYRSMNESAHRPFQSEWRQNLLFMWRPDACAMVQAQGFTHGGNPGMPTFLRRLRLQPGEEITLTCYAAISSDSADLHPALAALYRHTALEWINLAASFWAGRLGRLQVRGGTALEQRALDFHMRCILDNFNCYQMDERGELVAHLQGAPSQISGRFWGIDAEPTALSVLYALPELAGPILRYVAWRNRPAYSPYPDHSTPIFVAPMIIAAKYYELTGDAALFTSDRRLMDKLTADAKALLALRHPTGLLPSRYSSDGHVFHRYDFGTNCKAHYAFIAFAPVLKAAGERDLAAQFRKAAGELRRAVLEHMCAEGPFGRQISGGTNLGEHEPFYLRDDLMYYDGEDSSSCMAWLYGLMDLSDPLWQNYHRFARSLFSTNFDAEAEALRWFAWGMAIDGTALISAVGGSTSRAEMARKLQNLFDLATDDTGAMFWWPRAKNYVRGLTRCSQGQGAWIFQHTEQWLGLRMDEPRRTLRVQPQGLYGGYEWLGARLGAGRFDIRLSEEGDALALAIRNHTQNAYTIELCGRSKGAAFSNGDMVKDTLAPDAELRLSLPCPEQPEAEPIDIALIENRVHAPQRPALGTYLYELPRAYDTDPGIFILPFAILSGPRTLRDVTLTVVAPETFMLKLKSFMMLDEIARFDRTATTELGDIPANARVARSVYIALPQKYQKSDAWMTRASFVSMAQDDVERMLMLKSDHRASLGELTATLSWSEADGSTDRVNLSIPIEALPASEFDRARINIFGGTNVALHERLQ